MHIKIDCDRQVLKEGLKILNPSSVRTSLELELKKNVSVDEIDLRYVLQGY